MKLMFEKVLPTENSSWRHWIYSFEFIEFNWHYHPEYEIALTLNSQGQRYVGDSIENFHDLDLALLGPHLPHTWCSAPNQNGQTQHVYIGQIPSAWLESLIYGMPDLTNMKSLLTLSRRGLSFSQQVARQATYHFKAMKLAFQIHFCINCIFTSNDFTILLAHDHIQIRLHKTREKHWRI